MKPSVLFSSILLATSLMAGAAQAGARFEHNGSLMNSRMVRTGPGFSVTITYTSPRDGMLKAGALPGTTLFQGYSKDSINVNGTAYIFKQGCAPSPYEVSGKYAEGQLVMSGLYPIFARGSCDIVRYDSDGENGTLIFNNMEME